MAYDRTTDKLKLVFADNQKKAFRKAVNKHGVIPRRTDHIRPQTGTADLMKTKKFNEFKEAELV